MSVLSLLLVHSSMRAYRHRLLASLLRVLLDSKLFTATPASDAGCDRPLLYGMIFAVLTCCDANDWAPADQVAGSDNQSQEATVQLVEQWTTEAEKSADSSLLLPPAVAVYLARHLVEAQLVNMPAAGQCGCFDTKPNAAVRVDAVSRFFSVNRCFASVSFFFSSFSFFSERQ